MSVVALYVRSDSIYKQLGIDSYDMFRDARTYSGRFPVICHPPCRTWGRLRHFSNGSSEEHELSIIAVCQVRQHGGILEHPVGSALWHEMKLPLPCQGVDEYGGYTICVNQSWFGHPSEKRTLLYIVGIDQRSLPDVPLNFDAIQYVVSSSRRKKIGKVEMKKTDRDKTPAEFAKWLIRAAQMIGSTKLRSLM